MASLARETPRRSRPSEPSACPLIHATAARRGAGVSRAASTSTRSWRGGRQPIMAFWHGRILPAIYYFRNRGIVVITSENFDGEWIARHHPPVRLRTVARIDVARTPRARRCRAKRQMEEGARRIHARRTARPGARGAARRACGWPRPRATRSCRFTSRPPATGRRAAGTPRRCPSRSAASPSCIGEPLYVPADADEAALEAKRVALEKASRTEGGRSRCCGQGPGSWNRLGLDSAGDACAPE